MKEVIEAFVEAATSFLISYGPISGILLVVSESLIPVLPLSVLVTLNMISFGSFFGFMMSWISTVVGCICAFSLIRYFFRDKFERFINKKDNSKLKSIMSSIDKISFSNLVVFIALPFSPSVLINLAGGLSKVDPKKFIVALIIGKGIMVYFLGYIGTSLLESLTDITVLFRIAILLAIAELISKVVEKKLKIE